MTTIDPAAARIDRDRVAALTERQREIHRQRTAGSAAMFERASAVMPGGVPSQFQKNDPWPVYLDRGDGARVWDVDGNEYTDFHNGFGVMCVGHANPVIGAAVKARMDEGTHFAAPTTGSIEVAEELRRRWGLPFWRFNNSGTEATMDATHLARGSTGREVIVKIEGTYHGHHDSVMVSVKPAPDVMGDRERPASVAYGSGYPKAMTALTRAVPFNDAAALEHRARRARGPGRRPDHGAGDDEHQHRPAGRRLPRARARADRRARHRADLRRGQDRRRRRRRRRDRALRRHARRRVPGEGDLRRPAGRRGRHDRRAGRARGRRPRPPAGHVQRQSALDGRRQGDAGRRADQTTPTPGCTPRTRR